jgi:hypothetical protein
MPPRRRIDPAAGREALVSWTRAPASSSRTTTATAVRYLLEELSLAHPGNSVEFRVPPFGVTQFVDGPRHTRGTPPNVVETDAATFLEIAGGMLSWEDARESGRLTASGTRTDLAEYFPLFRT